MTADELISFFHNYINLEEKHDQRPTGQTRDTLKKYRILLKKELDARHKHRTKSELNFEAQ